MSVYVLIILIEVRILQRMRCRTGAAAQEAFKWAAELGSRIEIESNSCNLINLTRKLHAELIKQRFQIKEKAVKYFEIAAWSTTSSNRNYLALNLANFISSFQIVILIDNGRDQRSKTYYSKSREILQ